VAPGRSRGPAVAVDGEVSPAVVRPGAILVAKVIHPYMATLFIRAGGVVVEDGGILQHAAILAREFGIPAVVGVANAVERFGGAAELVIDGGTGEVVAVDDP
jgi:pyruvate,water dikinase